MIDDYTEQRIKSAANIVDVFAHLGFELRRSGSGYVTRCPFHADRSPSMAIHPAKNICKCFACGDKARDPVQFVMDYEGVSYPDALKRLADISGIYLDQSDTAPRPAKPRTPPPPIAEPQPTYTDPAIMAATLKRYDNNPLFVFMASMFDGAAVSREFLRYNVGTARHQVNPEQNGANSTIFWQVDDRGAVRGGKIVAYNGATGKRIKSARGGDVTWVHSAMRTRGYVLNQCLFGQHLIADGVDRVNIVESEKTAILCSLYYGDTLGEWVATGGKDVAASKRRIMDALGLIADKGVILYPDADGYTEWGELCESLKAMGVNATLSGVMRKFPKGCKYDIGDFIVAAMAAPTAPERSAPDNTPGGNAADQREPLRTYQPENPNPGTSAPSFAAPDVPPPYTPGAYDIPAPTIAPPPQQHTVADPFKDNPQLILSEHELAEYDAARMSAASGIRYKVRRKTHPGDMEIAVIEHGGYLPF